MDTSEKSGVTFRSAHGATPVGAVFRGALVVVGLAVTIADVGSAEAHLLLPTAASRAALSLVLALYIASILVPAMFGRRGSEGALRRAVRAHRLECVIAGAALALFWVRHAEHVGMAALGALQLARAYVAVARRSTQPSFVFVCSFALLVLAGAGALMLPAATPANDPITPIDALFTSTSAVCVTGLIVRDTASEFTPFGQTVILILIQLGGLGILLFGALLAMVLGSSLGFRELQATGGSGGAPLVRRLLVVIPLLTIAIESIGAAALYFGWPGSWTGAPPMVEGGDRLFHSVFFSVSAFCNAGFATTPNSLQGLRFDWTSHIVIAALITLGGLGFPVLAELIRAARNFTRPRLQGARLRRRLNLHTKIVLSASLVLYIAGVVGIFLARTEQGGQPMGSALLDAHFFSVSARTAGFDTVAPADLGPFSRMVLIFLMFIGGSPGSTAGGVKTVVAAVLIFGVWSTILGRTRVEAFRRTIPDALVKQAAALIVLGLVTVIAISSVLLAVEGKNFPFNDLVFEAVSACGTVGLSTGVTPHLGATAKIAVIAGMFLGRVGPLAVFVSLVAVARRHKARYTYPSEDLVIS